VDFIYVGATIISSLRVIISSFNL